MSPGPSHTSHHIETLALNLSSMTAFLLDLFDVKHLPALISKLYVLSVETQWLTCPDYIFLKMYISVSHCYSKVLHIIHYCIGKIHYSVISTVLPYIVICLVLI